MSYAIIATIVGAIVVIVYRFVQRAILLRTLSRLRREDRSNAMKEIEKLEQEIKNAKLRYESASRKYRDLTDDKPSTD